MLKLLVCACCVSFLSSCAAPGSVPARGPGGFHPNQLAKTDVDRVAEAHQREIFQNLRLLAEKLYRRNPRELKKGRHPTVSAGVARIFDAPHEWKFAELDGARGIHAIQLAFGENFAGDRVLAFVGGLGGMIQSAFHDKTELFVWDDLDPQALYNAARNVEIAVWKLSNSRSSKA